MKRYLLRTLQEAAFVWIALTAGVIITSTLYTVLTISQLPKSTSLLISFVTLVGLIILGLFLPTKSILLYLELSGERKLWLIFGVGCFLIIVIALIFLRSYWELIGFFVVGLAALAVVMALALRVIRALTDVVVKIHEQKLRQERLRPNDYGYYEIPVDGGKSPISPPRSDQHREEEKPGTLGYDPKNS